MREFDYIFDVGLRKGIRNDDRLRLKEQTLYACNNFRVGPNGIHEMDFLDDGDSRVAQTKTMLDEPHGPYFWDMEGRMLEIHRYTTATPDVYDWRFVVAKYGAAKIYTSVQGGSIAYKRHFEFANFGKHGILTSPTSTISYEYNYDDHAITMTDIIHGGTAPPMMMAVNFRGQCVCVLSVYAPLPAFDLPYSPYLVAFSDIGSLSFDKSSRQGAGNIYLDPVGGEIVKLAVLENHVLVFTTNGIWALTPVTRPRPTFRKRRIFNKGIDYPWAACALSDGSKACAILKDGTVALITDGDPPKVVEVGYREFFKDYTMYSSVREDFQHGDFILRRNTSVHPTSEDNVSLYRLTDYGLTATTRFSTHLSTFEDTDYKGKHIISGKLDAAAIHYPSVTTDVTDFGVAGIKTIDTIVLEARSTVTPIVTVYYRYGTLEKFSSTTMAVNDRGEASGPVAGVEFMIMVTFPADPSVNITIDRITVRYKMSDMRAVRGVHAPGLRGQVQ